MIDSLTFDPACCAASTHAAAAFEYAHARSSLRERAAATEAGDPAAYDQGIWLAHW